MAIFSVYILNRAGGLIYHYDHFTPKSEVEKTFSYPLDIMLREDDKLVVIFGERDGIKGNDFFLHLVALFLTTANEILFSVSWPCFAGNKR